MPTISKFYLHDAVTPNTGTMPTGVFINGGGATSQDTTGDSPGARTARTANDLIGTLQTSSVFTSNANTNNQQWGHRRFVSAPLATQTLAAADGNWTFSTAAAESNTNHNGSNSCLVYVWRPSTGVQVGTCYVQMVNPVSATSETALSATSSLLNGPQSILGGDVLVFEIFDNFNQGMATAYTSTFFYDGTTEASITSCASFVSPPTALLLLDPAPGPPLHQSVPFYPRPSRSS